MARISTHKKALGAVLSAGLAQGHRGNPAASLRIQNQYGTGVLFSGLASLVLSKAEVKIIDQHYLLTVQRLQKLHEKTPRSLVLLMAGCVPGEAILHLKQLTMFSMICHLPDDPLHLHGVDVLLSAHNRANSWFQQILALCLKYSLDHPHFLLKNPPPKPVFKRMVKRAVISYWENILQDESSSLKSLHYFAPFNCSLQQPHPIWITAGSNTFECHKSAVLARMISGRYHSDYLARHWTSNKLGHCLMDTCPGVIGTIEHLLIVCPSLSVVRGRLRNMILTKTKVLVPLCNFIFNVFMAPPETQTQFFLEPLAFPQIRELCEIYGKIILSLIFYCVRTYVYYIHRQKQILAGNWQGDMAIKSKKKRKNFTTRKSKSVPDPPHIYDTNYHSFPVSDEQPGQPLLLPGKECLTYAQTELLGCDLPPIPDQGAAGTDMKCGGVAACAADVATLAWVEYADQGNMGSLPGAAGILGCGENSGKGVVTACSSDNYSDNIATPYKYVPDLGQGDVSHRSLLQLSFSQHLDGRQCGGGGGGDATVGRPGGVHCCQSPVLQSSCQLQSQRYRHHWPALF